MTQTEIISVPVGKAKDNRSAKLCTQGKTKLEAHRAKLQYRSAMGKRIVGSLWTALKTGKCARRIPYVFARYLDAGTGKDVRIELGRWLLGSTLPVIHKNGDLLDFRLENLEARESEKQKARRLIAEEKRNQREAHRAKREAKRALRPQAQSDGLTPEQQLEVLFSEDFQKLLLNTAGSIVKDFMQRGTAENPSDEMRAPEIVQAVTSGSIERVLEGKVRNIRAYAYSAVRTQAQKERGKIWAKLGHVNRPKFESQTLSDYQKAEV